MAVRSKVLAAQRVLATNSLVTLYTCPAGRTAVLKAWYVSNFTANVVGWRLYLRAPDSTRMSFAGMDSPVQSWTSQPETYIVVPPGWGLGMFVILAGGRATEDLAVVLSGVELEGVAT